MRPIYPHIAATPHVALGYYNLNTVISNVLSVALNGNQRPFYAIRATDADGYDQTIPTYRNLLKFVCAPTHVWQRQPEFENDRNLEFGDDVLFAWIKMLSSKPKLYGNMSTRLEELISNVLDNKSSTKVATPTTGYARVWSDVGLMPTGSRYGLRLPSVNSGFSMKLAELLMALDTARFTVALVPDMKSVGSKDYKSRPLGQALAWVQQQNETLDTPVLYLAQGPAFIAALHKEFNAWRAEVATTHDVRVRTAVDARLEAEDKILSTVRLHPLLSAIVSGMRRTNIIDYYGKDAPLYRLMYERGDGSVLDQAFEVGQSDGALDAAFIRECVQDQTAAATRLEDWGAVREAKTSKDGVLDLTPTTVSYGEYARQLASLGDIPGRWGDLARRLGWQDVTLGISTASQAGAEFVLTDGISYSEDPSVCMLGLKPCIAVSNISFVGRIRRFMSDWNTNIVDSKGRYTRIEYSVITVNGYQTPVDGSDVYMRTYIPAGMLMGEPDVTFLRAPAIEANPVFETVVASYSALSPNGYVRYQYGEPTGQHSAFHTTDWDGYAVGQATEAIDGLLAGYDKYVEPAKDAAFAFADRFYHRVVVKNSVVEAPTPTNALSLRMRVMPERGTGPVLYDVLHATGRPWARLRQDGNVAFDGENRLGSTTSPMESVVNMFAVGDHPLTAALGEAQVTVDEPLATGST